MAKKAEATAAAVSLKTPTPHDSTKMIETETKPNIEVVPEAEPEVKEVVSNVQEIPAGISGGGTGREGTDGE